MAETAHHSLGDIAQLRKHLANGIGAEKLSEIGEAGKLSDLQDTDKCNNGNNDFFTPA